MKWLPWEAINIQLTLVNKRASVMFRRAKYGP